jgi:hypothetical protein
LDRVRDGGEMGIEQFDVEGVGMVAERGIDGRRERTGVL